MSISFHDRVKETTTTTGTGPLTLAGAVAQFKSFSSRYAVNADDMFNYYVVGQTGAEWEAGIGQLTATSTMARISVTESSNNDTFVNFSAGTKDVFVAVPGTWFNNDTGLDICTSLGIYQV
jgi:hypothetical protein